MKKGFLSVAAVLALSAGQANAHTGLTMRDARAAVAQYAGKTGDVGECHWRGRRAVTCLVSYIDVEGPLVDTDSGQAVRGNLYERVWVRRVGTHIRVNSSVFDDWTSAE